MDNGDPLFEGVAIILKMMSKDSLLVGHCWVGFAWLSGTGGARNGWLAGWTGYQEPGGPQGLSDY